MSLELRVCLALVALIAAVFGQVYHHDFINLDDTVYITGNLQVQRGLCWETVRWAFSSTDGEFWFPLTWISHLLDWQLFGNNPGGHHLMNVLFHMMNTLLVFMILRGFTGQTWQSALVATLFGLHPIHVETVAWASERKDVLFAFFWLLTFWSYGHYTRNPSISKYLPVMFFAACGMMSKPMCVTLPFALLLFDYWPLERIRFKGNRLAGVIGGLTSFRRILAEKTPLIAFSAAISLITLQVQKAGVVLASVDALPVTARVSNALVSYVAYLIKMLWPHNLALPYPHPGEYPWWQVGLCLSFLTAVTTVFFRHRNRRPYLMVGWLWYLGTLVPAIGLVQSGAQALADRFVYIPFIGIYVISAWGLSEFFARVKLSHSLKVPLTAAWVVVLIICTWNQLGYWANSVMLFRHTDRVTSGSFVQHRNLGLALVEQGHLDEALYHFRKALQFNRDDPRINHDLGTALMLTGNSDEAVVYLKRAAEMSPHRWETRHNLGLTAMMRGNKSEAIQHFREALRLKPDYVPAREELRKATAALRD